MDAVMISALLAGFLAVMSGIVLLSAKRSSHRGLRGQPAMPHGVPFSRRAVLFSKAERAFYETLRGMIPDHMIFVKVKLPELLAANQSQLGSEHLSALKRKHVDFVICDITLAPVLAIDLHNAKTEAAGPTADLLTSALAQAALPLVHVPQRPHYLLTELRHLLGPYLAVPRPMF
jgi:Protein of unknown function (DUF2726)